MNRRWFLSLLPFSLLSLAFQARVRFNKKTSVKVITDYQDGDKLLSVKRTEWNGSEYTEALPKFLVSGKIGKRIGDPNFKHEVIISDLLEDGNLIVQIDGKIYKTVPKE